MVCVKSVKKDSSDSNRKSKKEKAVKIAVVIVVLSAVAAFLGKDFLLCNFLPDKYAILSAVKTGGKLWNEFDDFGNEFTKIDTRGDNLTLKIGVSADEIRGGKGNVKIDASVSRSKKDGNFKLKADAAVNSDAYNIAEGLWDSEVIAFKSEALLGDETVYTLPSKNFGKKFNESIYADKFDVPQNLDLDAEKFLSREKNEADWEFTKKIANALGKFAKNTKAEKKDKGSLEIDGKERKVDRVGFEARGEDVLRLAEDCNEILKQSEQTAFYYNILSNYLLFEEKTEEIAFEDTEAVFYIYKGMAVRLEIEVEGGVVFFGFTKTKNLADNFVFGFTAHEDEKGKSKSFFVEGDGNLLSGEDRAENTYRYVKKRDGKVETDTLVRVSFDFENEEFFIEKSDETSKKRSATIINGQCKRGADGFSVTVDGLCRVKGKAEYNLLGFFAEDAEIKIEILPVADVEVKLNEENRKDILLSEESEFDELVRKLSDGFHKIINI